MNQTANLHLPQFAASDRIHHDDFNDAFAKIDTAVTNRIKVGSYTGNGAATRTIDLGFTPSAVLIVKNNGAMYSDPNVSTIYYTGGLALKNAPCTTDRGYTVFSVVTNGFKVCKASYHSGDEDVSTNESGSTYYYVAFI